MKVEITPLPSPPEAFNDKKGKSHIRFVGLSGSDVLRVIVPAETSVSAGKPIVLEGRLIPPREVGQYIVFWVG